MSVSPIHSKNLIEHARAVAKECNIFALQLDQSNREKAVKKLQYAKMVEKSMDDELFKVDSSNPIAADQLLEIINYAIPTLHVAITELENALAKPINELPNPKLLRSPEEIADELIDRFGEKDPYSNKMTAEEREALEKEFNEDLEAKDTEVKDPEDTEEKDSKDREEKDKEDEEEKDPEENDNE